MTPLAPFRGHSRLRLASAAVVFVLTAACLSGPKIAPTTETLSPEPRPPPTATPSTSAHAPPVAANRTSPPKPEKVASGHIVAGGPHGRSFRTLAVLGAPGVDAFFFQPPVAGTNVTTVTKDPRGLGYDLDFNFHDTSGTWLGGCQTAQRDEVCIVPKGAARGEVAAHAGADLDVDVWTAPDKEGTPPSRGTL